MRGSGGRRRGEAIGGHPAGCRGDGAKRQAVRRQGRRGDSRPRRATVRLEGSRRIRRGKSIENRIIWLSLRPRIIDKIPVHMGYNFTFAAPKKIRFSIDCLLPVAHSPRPRP